MNSKRSNVSRNLHSAEYFGRQRSFWWNSDFLSLMATRWNLRNANKILDVGCGVGHWGMIVLSEASPTTRMIGVDREPSWVDQATKKASELGLSDRLSYQVGVVEDLPFPDNTFDVVTCQTLLIHVKNVEAALAEMYRVLKPGGKLCVVEPNNIARGLATADILDQPQKETVLKSIEFQMTCEMGKSLLGMGHNSLGEALPGYFSKLNLKNISIFMSDKCFSYVPPYSTPSEQAHLEQALAWAEREFWIWSREETKKYYLAGGGAEDKFESLWTLVISDKRDFVRKVKNQTYAKAGGGIIYLVHGEKYE